MLPSEARELKQLRDENAKLKRLVADLPLDEVMLQDVAAALERLRFDHGLPATHRLRLRHGVRQRRDGPAGVDQRVRLDFSRRGKPTDNAAIESFNGRFRDERLNVHWFQCMEDAATKLEAWRAGTTMRIILTERSRAVPR